MRLRNLITIFMVSFLFYSSIAEAAPPLVIMGSNDACTEDVYTYSVVNDPAVFYEWTITGGAFTSSPIGSNSVDAIWYNTGSITLSAYSDAGLTLLVNNGSMSVNVDLLSPFITMDPEVGCLDEDRNSDEQESFIDIPEPTVADCHMACEDNLISYFSNGNPGSTFTWEVFGDVNIVVNSSSELRLEWLTVGFGTITLTETSVNGCVAETEICVEVIAKPEALFDVLPGLTVCIGQEVFFTDLSSAIGDSDLTAWEWSVSDGTFQAYTESNNFSHIFTTGGPHEVNLRVYNTCGCYDDYLVEINVINSQGPDIFCPKVVCPNEKTVLSTSSTCGTYLWSVDNGTILSGLGTTSITVMWNDTPDGVGYAYLSTPCGACNIPTVLEIPILGTNLEIDGPLQVCEGDQVTLSVPEVDGTFYNWSVSSSPTSASIIQTIHNQVIIDVFGSALITVTVDYNNQFAGCGDGCEGSSSHTMIATAPSYVFGDENVCVGDTKWYGIFGPATGDISVEKPDNTTVTIPNGGSYTYTDEGIHIITPDITGCKGDPLFVNAHAIPAVVDMITGETEICPFIPYIYEAGNDVDGTIYSWNVSGGTPITGVGKEIVVTWDNSGSHSIEVSRINIETPNCASEPIELIVNELTVAFGISGDDEVCANTEYTYSISYIDGEEYNWSIAAEGQGSVITDPNSSTVDVLWNNTTGPAIITGSVRMCNVWYTETFAVTIDPSSNVTFVTNDADNIVCQGDNIVFTADLGYDTYDWSISPAFGGSIPNSSSFNRDFTQEGTFNVSVLATDECGNVSMHSEIITVWPAPPSQLSISFNDIECVGGTVVSGSATLVTSVIGDVSDFSFFWPHDGSITPTVTVTNTGIYEVTVTNITTGCTAVERIKIKCPNGPPCSMPAANTGTFAFAYDNVTCGQVTFFQTGVNSAPGWTLTGSDFIHQGINGFNEPAPSFTYSSFNEAGYYTVTNKLCYSHFFLPDCCKSVSQIVPIPVVAKAAANAYCDMSGSYMIHLDDFSSSVSDLAGYDVSWYIGGGLVSSMTGVTSGTTDVSLGALIPGNSYTVLLKVEVPMIALPGMPSSYECEYETTISIPALPDANFTIATPGCLDLDVEFTGAFASNTTFDWTFGDGANLIQNVNTAARKYENSGSYIVNLEVTNAAGCVATSSGFVSVYSNEFGTPDVDVDPSGPICQPNPATLTYTHSGTATPTDYIWSDGATVNPNIVFEAGGYIVTVSDSYGCISISDLTAVDIRPAPSALIVGESSYCFDVDLPVELFGYAGPGLTYQWRRKAFGGTWLVISSGSQISDNSVTFVGSPYEYELTVTDPLTGCSAITIKSVDIKTPPPVPSVTTAVVNCDPYTTRLTANSILAPVDYSWSNGDSGSPIDVLHGGPYEVTLTDLTTGCISTREFDVEGAPNLDFFPVGCYVYCKDDLPLYYPGPYGSFDTWRLLRDDGMSVYIMQSGSGSVANLAITAEGRYSLMVTDNGCTFVSGFMEVEFDDTKCDDECEEPCIVDIGEIIPDHVEGCLYEFNADIYLGECTSIVNYVWTIDNVVVPGGANMSYLFDSPGGNYVICLLVIGVNEQGQNCKDKVCIEFKPTCKCECDITADFDVEQQGCEFFFVNTSEHSECTNIDQYYWTFEMDGDIFFESESEEVSYGFEGLNPVEVCLTVYGNDGAIKCEDTHCETIYPCNSDGQNQNRTEEEKLGDASLTLSPNPVLDRLRIESTGLIGKEWHVVIVDIAGRKVSDNVIQAEGGMIIMPTDGWNSGIYTISVSDELGNKFNEKIIKID